MSQKLHFLTKRSSSKGHKRLRLSWSPQVWQLPQGYQGPQNSRAKESHENQSNQGFSTLAVVTSLEDFFQTFSKAFQLILRYDQVRSPDLNEDPSTVSLKHQWQHSMIFFRAKQTALSLVFSLLPPNLNFLICRMGIIAVPLTLLKRYMERAWGSSGHIVSAL